MAQSYKAVMSLRPETLGRRRCGVDVYYFTDL